MAPLSVLLVGSDPGYLRLATQFLQRRDDIVVFGSQFEHLQHLISGDPLVPDVIFLNLTPELNDGLSLVSKVRKLSKDVKIVVLAQWNAEEHRQAAIDAGADELISKSHLDVDDLPEIWRTVTSWKTHRLLSTPNQ